MKSPAQILPKICTASLIKAGFLRINSHPCWILILVGSRSRRTLRGRSLLLRGNLLLARSGDFQVGQRVLSNLKYLYIKWGAFVRSWHGLFVVGRAQCGKHIAPIPLDGFHALAV